MKTGKCALVLGTMLLSAAMVASAEPAGCAGGACAAGSHVSHGAHGGQKCGATFWQWLCYRPRRLPCECESCLSPSRTCTPPIHLFFVNRYPSAAHDVVHAGHVEQVLTPTLQNAPAPTPAPTPVPYEE